MEVDRYEKKGPDRKGKEFTYPVPPVAGIVTVALAVEVLHDEDLV